MLLTSRASRRPTTLRHDGSCVVLEITCSLPPPPFTASQCSRPPARRSSINTLKINAILPICPNNAAHQVSLDSLPVCRSLMHGNVTLDTPETLLGTDEDFLFEMPRWQFSPVPPTSQAICLSVSPSPSLSLSLPFRPGSRPNITRVCIGGRRRGVEAFSRPCASFCQGSRDPRARFMRGPANASPGAVSHVALHGAASSPWRRCSKLDWRQRLWCLASHMGGGGTVAGRLAATRTCFHKSNKHLSPTKDIKRGDGTTKISGPESQR